MKEGTSVEAHLKEMKIGLHLLVLQFLRGRPGGNTVGKLATKLLNSSYSSRSMC